MRWTKQAHLKLHGRKNWIKKVNQDKLHNSHDQAVNILGRFRNSQAHITQITKTLNGSINCTKR